MDFNGRFESLRFSGNLQLRRFEFRHRRNLGGILPDHTALRRDVLPQSRRTRLRRPPHNRFHWLTSISLFHFFSSKIKKSASTFRFFRFCWWNWVESAANHLELPYLSAYLNSIGANFRHGANFATGGSTIRRQNESVFLNGASPFSLDIQVVQFRQFKNRTIDLYREGFVEIFGWIVEISSSVCNCDVTNLQRLRRNPLEALSPYRKISRRLFSPWISARTIWSPDSGKWRTNNFDRWFRI